MHCDAFIAEIIMECLTPMSAPTTSLILIGSDPGTVAGLAMPLAAEARRQAAERRQQLEIALLLPPCQYASGQEQGAADSSGLFDRVIGPAATQLLSMGLSGWSPVGVPIVLHVGGDVWYSRRLAKRWSARAFAFVEGAQVARAHQAFEQIFVPTQELSDRLIRLGAPAGKVLITGDPIYDVPGRVPRLAPAGARPTVTFLSGSRDRVFASMFPFWIATAAALRTRQPEARLVVIISPFVSPRAHRRLVAEHRRALDDSGIEVDYGGWPAIVGSDLVFTIPGTNTLELAVRRIPAIVTASVRQAATFPLEGSLGWIARLPGVGPPITRRFVRAYLRRHPFVALPNVRTRRRIMPELVGDLTPDQVADEGARLLQDEAARQKIIQDLMEIPDETGASRRILARINLFQTAA